MVSYSLHRARAKTNATSTSQLELRGCIGCLEARSERPGSALHAPPPRFFGIPKELYIMQAWKGHGSFSTMEVCKIVSK